MPDVSSKVLATNWHQSSWAEQYNVRLAACAVPAAATSVNADVASSFLSVVIPFSNV